MPRLLRVLTAVLVGAASLLITGPAHAAGDTYGWVAPGPGNFTNPANWERLSDGEPGVPGAEDAALIGDPPGTVTINSSVTVASLTVDAEEDGQGDVLVTGFPRGSVTAGSVVLSGDSDIRGPVVTENLRMSGALEVNGGFNFQMVDSGDAPSDVVLDGVQSSDLIRFSPFSGSDVHPAGDIDLKVVGDGPTEITALAFRDVTVDLTDDAGAVFAGSVFASGHLGIMGDVPVDAKLCGGCVLNEDPGSVVWDASGPVTLDGLLAIEPGRPATLPDDLTVNGVLGNEGPASGGSVHLGPDGAIRLTAVGDGSAQEPNLSLSGALTSASTAEIWIEPPDTVCAGDEDLLVRAAEGVDFPPGEIGLDGGPAGMRAEGVVLGDELVAVYEDDGSGCDTGRTHRVVRGMYRDLVGRRADSSGAAYWTRKIDDQTAPATVAARLLATAEARTHLVRSTFEVWGCDGEAPSDDAVAFWAEYLRTGGSLVAVRAEVLAMTIPVDADPVECTFSGVVGRSPDPGGRAYVEGRLEVESVQKVARRLMTTSEGRRVQFDRLYQHLLGRAATTAEVTSGAQQIAAGRAEVHVAAGIAGSTEYKDTVT